MAKVNFRIKAGESLTLRLKQIEGDFSIVDNITVTIKKAGPNGTVPPLATPSIASFVVEEEIDGWLLTIDESITATWAYGLYVADAKLLIGTDVIKTEAVVIEVGRSVT